MDYERIDPIRTSVISPGKLRLKLMRPNSARRDGETSSSKSCLLMTNNDDLEEEEQGNGRNHHHQLQPSNCSTVHPIRTIEEDRYELDGGQRKEGSSCFQFPNGGRTLHRPAAAGAFFRPLPSKWNDAEKWIVRRESTCRALGKGGVRGQTCLHDCDERADVVGKGAGACDGFSLLLEKQRNRKDHMVSEERDVPPRASVCMKDMGTEMTPIPSEEPSRIGTPLEIGTPIRTSCNSSMSSTPRRAPPTPCPTKSSCDIGNKVTLSDEEFRLKTQEEIIALAIKLGKTNITAWARRNVRENFTSSRKPEDVENSKNAEFQFRAAAWESAEKSKHMASFKREELKIKMWESKQKAKFQDELTKVEVKMEKLRARAREKILKKLANVKQQSEIKLAAAEARKNRKAYRTTKRSAKLSMTSSYLLCCSW